MRSAFTPGPVDFQRREFLIRCCQGASAAFLPRSLRSLGLSLPAALDSPFEHSPGGGFHLHPHYRMPLPLDPVLLQTQSGLDEFVAEKYADQIAAVLAQWSSSLTRSPQDVTVFERVFQPNFRGTTWSAGESRLLRSGPIEVHRTFFARKPPLAQDAFLAELRSELNQFSRILTADLQITAIHAIDIPRPGETAATMPPPGGLVDFASGKLRTTVRYEIVGTTRNLHRKQRVGTWDLLWDWQDSGDFRLVIWQPVEETASSCSSPAFLDITSAVLGANKSYSAQLLHGNDYWRTVLDGSCGIDVYGHHGVSLGDIDGDGLDDLYICQPGGLPNRLFRNRGDGTFEDITEAAGVGVIENTPCAFFVDVTNSGRQDLIVVKANGPLLFLNDGHGKFHQKANAFHFAHPPQGTFVGAAVADYDRDGWLDIYFALYIYYQGANQYKYPVPYFDANNGPPNFLFRNNRDGTFHDATAETGLSKNNTRYSFCCAWNDFNNDGWPDLYVVNDFGRKNLYRNNGDGTFTDIAAEAGVEDIGAGMSACWFDYDNDGADDLYVANMWTAPGERITMQDEFKKNSPAEVRMLYHKHAMGNSLFKNSNPARVILSAVAASRSGAATESKNPYPSRKSNDQISPLSSQSSVSSVSSVVKGFSSTTPNITQRPGTPKFQDVTDSSGARIGRWAWSSDSFDFDYDGFPDLYIANGMVTTPDHGDLNSFFWRQVVAKSPDEPKPRHDYEQGWGAINELIRADRTWSGYERNVFYANNGDGTFSNISGVVGLDFPEDGRSFAVGDFDLDGRQEVFLKNRNAPQLRVLKNVLPSLPPAIAFRLRGTKSNRDAIGTVITIETERIGVPSKPGFGLMGWNGRQTRSLQAGSGFLAQHSKEVFFGLGPAKGPVSASVRWPSGLVQEFRDLPINHRIWIEEGAQSPSRVEPFRGPASPTLSTASEPQPTETLPATAETWLLAPVAAPDFSLPKVICLPASSLHKSASHPDPEQSEGEGSMYSAGEPERPASPGSPPWSSVYPVVNAFSWTPTKTAANLEDPTVGDCKQQTLSSLRGKPILLHFGAVGDQHTEKDWSTFNQHHETWAAQGLQLIAVNFSDPADADKLRDRGLSFSILQGSDDVAAIYNILFSYLFDRHRDLPLPTSLLIDADGEIVKVYQGPVDPAHVEQDFRNIPRTPADRLTRALPFPGVTEVTEFGRNYLSFGSVYFQRGYFDQAAASFQIALRDDPESAEALYGIGSVYLNQQKNADARDCFQRALKLRASYPDTLANSWNNLGLLAGREGRLTEAVADFQEALRLSPDHLIALNNLGSAYRQSKRWSEAQQTYERALALKPMDAEANYGLGMVYAQRDDTARAENYLRQALALRPDYPEALNNLGILYLRTNRRDQAVANFQESIRVAPDFDQAYLNLARVHAIEGNLDEARNVLRELLKRHPNHPAALNMMEQLKQ